MLPRVYQTPGNKMDFTVLEEGMRQKQGKEKDQVVQEVFTQSPKLLHVTTDTHVEIVQSMNMHVDM